MRQLLWFCGIWMVLVLVPSEGWAQTPNETSFVLQRFRPSFDPDGMYNTFGGESLGQWRFLAGLWLNFGYQPLIITGGKQGKRNIVDWQLSSDVGFGIGFLDIKWFGVDAYFNVPFSPFLKGGIPDTIDCGGAGQPTCQAKTLDKPAMGDMSLSLKLRVLGEKWQGIGVAVLLNLQLPTGDATAFHSEDQATFSALAAVSKTLGGVIRLAGNLGVRMRPERQFIGLTTTTELVYQAGLSLIPAKNRVEIMGEVGGAVALGSLRVQSAPLEILAGVKIYPLDEPTLALHIGGGVGALIGYGVPTFRAFVGVVYTSKEAGPSDRDKDGISDSEDACPDQAGPRRNKGCPLDRDKDGIIDRLDRCPDVPGPRENKGCPYGDMDKDGVMDNEDQCPNKPGPMENNGCPWGDKDGDGLQDNVDQCPEQAGPRENHGCPDQDRDKDTVVDRKDKCPDIPGPVSNNGCPLKVYIQVDKKTKRILLLEKVYFATARAKIRKRSFPVLEQVVSVMKSNPKIRIRVEGHTDSIGPASYNKRLSQRRTDSVKRFLVEKGIAGDRLVSAGFGEERPIASNKTRAGRAKNRRVEFHIID